jgi:hypothetical protein
LSKEAKEAIECLPQGEEKAAEEKIRESRKVLNDIKKNLKAFLEDMKKRVIEHLEMAGSTADSGTLSLQDFMAHKSMLESVYLFSKSLDLPTTMMNDEIDKMWKRSRLGAEIRTEALYLLRAAWNAVDTYWNEALHFKFYAKLLFCILIYCSMLISIVTVVYLNNKDNIAGDQRQEISQESVDSDFGKADFGKNGTETDLLANPTASLMYITQYYQFFVFFFSIIISVVTALTGFLKPDKRWLTFRAASLSLESEIWKFRTSFAINVKQDKVEKETFLREYMRRVQEQVSKSASTGTTIVNNEMAIFGDSNSLTKAQKEILIHGQYEDHDVAPALFPSLRRFIPSCLKNIMMSTMSKTMGPGLGRMCHEEDDHHKALDPEDYIRFRVKPAVLFYQARLPRYYAKLKLSEAVMIGGQVAGMLMASFNAHSWTALVTAVVTFTTSWRSYVQTDKKLTRYSNATERFNVVIPWWDQLGSIEKSNPLNIAKLVDTCEEILRSEWDTWTTTSMRLQKMSKKSAQNSEDVADDGK